VIIDLRYVYVEYELWALESIMAVIEPTIERAASQTESETLTELRERGWIHDDAERQFAYDHINEMREYVLPRLLRGPFVVALWAAFEAALKQVAWILARQLGASAPLASRGPDFLRRARTYFAESFGLVLDDNKARYDRLIDLYVVRNALAHANGLKDGMTEAEWSRLRRVGKRRRAPVDDWHDMLVLPASFVALAYQDVTGSVRELLSKARTATAHIPPQEV